jgi:excisionase family DNA binding protein
MDPDTDPIAVTVQQAISLIGLSRTTLYRMIQRGQLPAVRANGRILVEMAALRRFVAGCPPARGIATPNR